MSSLFQHLETAFKTDPDFAWAWHCNIAMPIHDQGESLIFANKCAAAVMRQLFGIDASKHPNFQFIVNPQEPLAKREDLNEYERGMTLDQFCRQQHEKVEAFKKHWNDGFANTEKLYPMWFSEEDTGQWDEQFAAFTEG